MWFLRSVGLCQAREPRRTENRPAHLSLLVLTPDNIPEFHIPPLRPGSKQGLRQTCGLNLAGMGSGLAQGKEAWPSAAAAGLVPLHANLPEILYLPESPHTRRKESLFHRPEAYPDLPGPETYSGLLRPAPCLWDSDTASSSAESSPFSSPTPPRSWPVPRGHQSTLVLDRGGSLSLEAEYRPEEKWLRLRLVAVRGAYPPPFQAQDVACCVTFCLLPGKTQRQRSAVIHGRREPLFREDFYFVGLPRDELRCRTLRLKVLNRGGGVRRDCLMGQCQLPLASVLFDDRALVQG